jgi:hypothetical protein
MVMRSASTDRNFRNQALLETGTDDEVECSVVVQGSAVEYFYSSFTFTSTSGFSDQSSRSNRIAIDNFVPAVSSTPVCVCR